MNIGVLGGGQLGRMLALAGYPLGHGFVFLDLAPEALDGLGSRIVAAPDDPRALDELAARVDLVTYEFENVPVTAVRALAQRVPVYPGPAALEVSQDETSITETSFETPLVVRRYFSSGVNAMCQTRWPTSRYFWT